MKKATFLIVAAVLAFACGHVFSEMKYPNWLLGKSPQYPGDKFVIAVGEAQDLSSSKTAAYEELRKLFNTRVEQIRNESKKIKPGAKKKKEEALTQQQLEAQRKKDDETNQYIDDMVYKASIQDTWYNGKANSYFALAVLDRKDYDAAFARSIARLDETIKTAMEATEFSKSYLEKVRFLSIALRSMERRIDVINMKRVIDPLAVGMLSKSLPREDVEKKRADFLKKVMFVVFDESNQKQTGMQEAIEAGLVKAGFVLGNRNSVDPASTVLLKFGLVIKTPADAQNGKKTTANWKCRFQLVDGTGKRMISSSSTEGQVTMLTERTSDAAVSTAKKAGPVAAVSFLRNFSAGLK